jgi:hypothetical protein
MSLRTLSESGVQSVVALGVLLVVVLAGLGIDHALEAPVMAAPTAGSGPLLAGASTCAAVAVGPGVGTTVATIVDTTDVPAVPEAWASLSVESGGLSLALPTPDATGRVLTSIVKGGDTEEDVLLTARWEATPLLMARRWEQGPAARVQGAIEGLCPSAAAPRWLIPGVATAGGAAATLHLANPSDVTASLSVTFLTPTGRVAPTRLANLVIPAHGRTTVQLNEFAPEEPDLGVEVVARTGTLVVEAVQTLEAAVGEIDGQSLVVAHTDPADTWTLPWMSAAKGESAWVWVTNPGTDPTDVRLVLHTVNGPVVPLASGLTLAPGTTQRLDLRGALADDTRGGITLRSTEGAPVVVSGAVLRSSDGGPLRAGIAVVEAIPAGIYPRAAALSTLGDDGRARFVALANPGDVDAVVDVAVVGRNALSPTMLADSLVLPAGGWAVLDLAAAIPIDGGFAVVITTTQGVAVGSLISESREGPLDLTAVLARPFPGSVDGFSVVVRPDRGLLHPIVEPSDDPAAVEPSAGPSSAG